jgi:hypothetical protein
MSDNRANIKVRRETYDLLTDAKGQYETWDGFFHRIVGDDE